MRQVEPAAPRFQGRGAPHDSLIHYSPIFPSSANSLENDCCSVRFAQRKSDRCEKSAETADATAIGILWSRYLVATQPAMTGLSRQQISSLLPSGSSKKNA